MKYYFDYVIKPASDKLERLLNKKNIPVFYSYPLEHAVTVQSGYRDTDGSFVLESCNHAGATEQEVDALEFDSDSHNFTPTGTAIAVICDKCDKQLDAWGQWS